MCPPAVKTTGTLSTSARRGARAVCCASAGGQAADVDAGDAGRPRRCWSASRRRRSPSRRHRQPLPTIASARGALQQQRARTAARGGCGTARPTVPASTRKQLRASGRSSRLRRRARQEDLARDHEALDLRGALVDLEQLRVAHQLLDRVLLDVAVAAEDLHGVGGDLHRRVGGEALRVASDAASLARPGRAATPPARRAAAPPRSRSPCRRA